MEASPAPDSALSVQSPGTGQEGLIALELISSGACALGVGLVLAALLIRLLNGSMMRTTAVLAGTAPDVVLRWHDRFNTVHEAPWLGQVPDDGDRDLTVFYAASDPDRWQLHRPHRGAGMLALVGVGLLLAGVTSAVLPL
ncbi:hypothetical protein [Arthrobacter zhaoguopingii]|uniref:hypothetical protein n=1 Tax=Arthrobacter zhaoguopingii TaxID=2681491 RepID=UPI00135AE71D|nr:hypothetical protein [Arthrobacter zhaoguopingii]